jgi:quercetin dioxygenase-like cupin family protein
MKTRGAIVTGLGLTLVALVAAQAAVHASVDRETLTAPTEKFVLHRKDIPQVTIYVWDKDGVAREAWPGDAQKPPADAVKLRIRIFPFRDGTLREVQYPKGARVRGITPDDTSSYLLSGRMIQTVNGVAHAMTAGDASFLSSGVEDVKEAAEASTLLAYHFPAKGAPPVGPTWIKGADVPVKTGAEWATGDDNHAALTPEAIAQAPPEARKFYLRTFLLPRWRIIESRIEQGLTSGWHGGAGATGMLYLAQGREVVHYRNGVNEEILPGDVFREPPIGEHRTETPENVFVIRGAVPEPR